MQNRKEELTEFVKTIKAKVRDWKSRHLWATRISAFIFLLLFFSFVVLTYANFYRVHTNVASARYMLSALVQSQVAIIAIIISLTLIAVQLTASAYSPRVISIFRHSYGWQALFVFYGISIFYGLLVLKMIKGVDDLSPITYLDISLEGHISIAYALGCFLFAMLIMYLQSIIKFLNPANIINQLATEITKDKILKKEEDPIQPIVDIIHGSIMKYDLETTRVGLKAVTDRVIKIIETEIIGSDDEKEISERFCSHLTRVGRLAISREDAESTIEVIKNFANFGEAAAEKELEQATTQAVMSLEEVGKTAAGKELGDATWEAVKFLGEVGVAAANQCLKDAASRAVSSLWETSRAVSSLVEVRKTAADKRLNGAIKLAAMCLGNIGEAAAKKGLEGATKWAVMCLEGVVVTTAEKHLEGATGRVAESLGIVGKTAANQCLKDVTSRAAASLIVVGITSAKNSLEDATRRVAKSLGLESATEKAARSLAELTILNEEIVKTAIQDSESDIKEQDPDSFQKFRKLYEQELEKLRAEN